MTTTDPCPCCGGGIPNDLTPGAYPGALSRYDNKTEICSGCGTAEALAQAQGHALTPPDQPVRFDRPKRSHS